MSLEQLRKQARILVTIDHADIGLRQIGDLLHLAGLRRDDDGGLAPNGGGDCGRKMVLTKRST